MLTFVQVTSGNPAANSGPLANPVTVTPSRTTGAGGVTLSATLDDSATGGSNVTAAEYFVDSLGAPGSGTALTVASGVAANVSAVIDAATLATWTSAHHTLYVRGQDALGAWGPAASVILNLDYTGPDSVSLNLAPNHTNGTVDVLFQGTADDSPHGSGTVVAATYSIDGGPATPLALNKQATVAGLSATIPAATVATLPQGARVVSVTSQDDLGNWGAAGTVTLTVDRTGPTTKSVALNPTTLNLAGSPPVAPVRLTATFQDELWSGVNSDVVNAEAFMGSAGANGTGFTLFPADGLFNSPVENAYFDIPAANFTSLAQGEYPVQAHAKDAAGNWGPAVYADDLRGSGQPGPAAAVLLQPRGDPKSDPRQDFDHVNRNRGGPGQRVVDSGRRVLHEARSGRGPRDPDAGRRRLVQRLAGEFHRHGEHLRLDRQSDGIRAERRMPPATGAHRVASSCA